MEDHICNLSANPLTGEKKQQVIKLLAMQ